MDMWHQIEYRAHPNRTWEKDHNKGNIIYSSVEEARLGVRIYRKADPAMVINYPEHQFRIVEYTSKEVEIL